MSIARVLAFLAFGGGVISSPTPQEQIRGELRERQNRSVDLSSLNACHMDDSESCDIASLPTTTATLVYPGGDTECIGGDAFAFEVLPGKDTSKLLFYFQGGGACWDQMSSKVPLCSQQLYTNSPLGIFDVAEKENPFADFTFVTVLYCSGDLHLANNKTQDGWVTARGETVRQTGQQNVWATIQWVKANLPSPLSSLVISGESAGSLGMQGWSKALLQELPADVAVLFMDSYLGVFPEGTQGPILRDVSMPSMSLPQGMPC